jgi:hypothetical protein
MLAKILLVSYNLFSPHSLVSPFDAGEGGVVKELLFYVFITLKIK